MNPDRHNALRRLVLETADTCRIAVLKTDVPEGLAVPRGRPGTDRTGIGDPEIVRDPEVCPLARRFRFPEPLVLLCLGRGRGPCPA